ncbi:MAG: cytochrome c, partial [Verrucomicrobia bacterium]|nr:cytochrome c [Verrucomicrobiota bacterium]
WTKNCASCHGPDGKGKTKAGRQAGVVDLTDSKVLEKFTDEQMFKRVREGVKDGDKTKMKPAEQLTDKEIQKLIAYVRTFKK